jgi:hypothetical protein
MAKALSKTTVRNKLDKICGQIVRSKGSCERCKSNKFIQCCHVFSRKFNNTRWDIENNLLCLCASCHRWAHDNPILFTEFVRKYFGEEKYQILKEKHNLITKYTLEDLQIKLKVLEEIMEKTCGKD